MNKLKKILLEEGTTLIPFSFISSKLKEDWGLVPGNKHRFNAIRRAITNCFISLVIPIYTISALSYGANPLKPQDYLQKRREVLEQRKVQKEQEMRDYSKEQFYEVDKNNDLVLDSNEFYDYIRGQRE